jgi:DNA-binding NtrC family response regulator
MTDECAERLLAYPWPGNVRELQNAIQRAVTFATSTLITVPDLPDAIRGYAPNAPPTRGDDGLITLVELERRHIVRVLLACGGNPAQAARVLGVSRAELQRKLVLHGVRSDGTLV